MAVRGSGYVYIPAHFSNSQEKEWVGKMVDMVKKNRKKKDLNKEEYLVKKIKEFNKKYFNSVLEINSIKYAKAKQATIK